MLLERRPCLKEHSSHCYKDYGHPWKGSPLTSAALCKNFSLHLGAAYNCCFRGRYDGWSRSPGATWGGSEKLCSLCHFSTFLCDFGQVASASKLWGTHGYPQMYGNLCLSSLPVKLRNYTCPTPDRFGENKYPDNHKLPWTITWIKLVTMELQLPTQKISAQSLLLRYWVCAQKHEDF